MNEARLGFGRGRRDLGLLLLAASLALAVGPARSMIAGLSPPTLSAPVSAAPAGPAQEEPAAIIHLPLAMADIRLEQMPLPSAAAPATATTEPTSTPTEQPATPTSAPTDPPTPTAMPTEDLPWWGAYDEPLTDFDSIDDLRSGYRAAAWYPTLLTLLERRYAQGRYIVTELKDSERNAGIWMGGQPASFDNLLGRVGLTVHEMDHQLGWQEGILATGLQSYAYVLREDLTLLVPRVETYPRAEIAKYLVGPLNNQYKPIYLEGDSGQQGFLTVLDEFNAYTHSLFVGYGLYDQAPPGRRQSDRDGLVTFMLYTQLYLRHARMDHPGDFDKLRAEPEIRDAVRTLWARANFILDLTEDIPSLSLDPAAVEAEMRKDEMQAEVRDFVAP